MLPTDSLAVIGGSALDITALRLLLPSMKGAIGEWRVRSAISPLCLASLHDVLIQDERGLTQIDHIALTAQGILAIETKNYAGTLYDNGRKKPWVQRIGRQKNKIHNPLDQSYRHRKALESLLPGTPVQDCVVLTGPARFGNQRPSGVLTLQELKRHLRELQSAGALPPVLAQDWEHLCALAKTDKDTRRRHLQSIPGGRLGAFRVTLGKILLLAGSAALLAGWVS